MSDYHNPYMLPTIVVIYTSFTIATFIEHGVSGLVLMFMVPVLFVLALAVQPVMVSTIDKLASLFTP